MTDLVIVECDEQADPIGVEAIEHLGQLALHGVVRPFWQAHPNSVSGHRINATEWGTGGPTDVDLLTALAGLRTVTRVRLVTIATDSLATNAVRPLATAADEVARLLASAQPAGVPFADVRLIAPLELQTPTHLTTLFSSLATANVVLFPEDRISDAGFALPMSAAEPATFSAHVAVEIATQVALWHDMDSAPVDAASPGLIAGDIGVLLARSYARIAVAPRLPVDRAIAASDVLPVPPGIEPAPLPHQTAGRYATQLFEKIDELHFHEPEPFSRRRQMSVRSTARLIRQEAAEYLRNLPYQVRHGAAADLQYAAGEALTAAIGESSVEVVWEGKVADVDGRLPEPVDVDQLRARLLERLRQPESPSFDQTVWSSMVDDVLAMVDGGSTSQGTQPPSIGSDRVAVVDPTAVAPNPAIGMNKVLEAIDSEPLSAPEPTAVGRISAQIREEISQSDSYVDGTLALITRQLDQLRSRRYPTLAVLAWIAGLLVACLVGSLAIFTRAAEAVGVLDWGPDTRLRLAQIGAVVLVAVLAGLLAAGLRGQEALGTAFGVFGSVLLAGVLISSGNWGVKLRLPEPIGTVRVGELALLATIGSIIILVLGFCSAQRTQRGRIAARLTGVLAIVLATVMVVVALVRPAEWYATVASDEFRSAGIRSIVSFSVALLLVLMALLVLRVRERLTVQELGASLRWAAQSVEFSVTERARLAQALRQWHGSAVAVARTVWTPFGAAIDEHRGSVVDVGLEGEIRKLQLYLHEPRDEDLLGVMSRIRQEVADPGWLMRQYRAAVDSFQPQYAFNTGRVVDSTSLRRPEADPAPEDPGLGAGSPGRGVRWMFANMLYGGSFDADLRSVGSRVALDAVLEIYFDRATAPEGQDLNLTSFGRALVEGESPSLPIYLFSKSGLPVAGDPRASFSTTIWWPESVKRPSTERTYELRPTKVSADNSIGLVVSFLRSDWSSPMPLNTLPFARPAGNGEKREPKPPARPGDESAGIM